MRIIDGCNTIFLSFCQGWQATPGFTVFPEHSENPRLSQSFSFREMLILFKKTRQDKPAAAEFLTYFKDKGTIKVVSNWNRPNSDRGNYE
jgi:hypothetical protein